MDIINILGSLSGFYLAFIIVAAIKEQVKLNQTNEIFKSEYIILIVLGFLAAVVYVFSF